MPSRQPHFRRITAEYVGNFKVTSRTFGARRRFKKRRLKLVPDKMQPPKGAMPKERGHDDYKDLTGIDFEKEFRGKRVLDVGCGVGNFVTESRGKGVLAEGIDPLFDGRSKNIHRAHLHEFKPKHKYACVVSVFGVPFNSKNSYNTRLSLYDMLRLVKPGGKVVIHGWHPEKPRDRKQTILWAISGSTLRKLSFLKFELFEFVPLEGNPIFRTLIIEKKNENQVESLGKWFGVI